MKCLHHQWPDEKKTRCLPKLEEFLSITGDMISQFFLLAPVLFCIVTAVVLGILISHQRTPLVKANNKVLSFVLLVCIMLGFLSVFLFLGRPVDLTCLLRQISFGIPFTIAISSVLGKTIMVYIAFKATKPGSTWKKWLGNKLLYYLVIGCSSVQVLICLVWLTISPPFQELDTHCYKDKIIVQCNEGSVIGFYSVLGYMGLLAAVSFVTAFITRTLPDSFNEAKYITFSMLVFCSVWIAMIPAYLSTKGKYMVTVEIFAILASNMGLLGCIFFPKCYVIIYRPQMNTKTYMMSKGRCNGPF
ncbi:vomeronasal type-2 receptor 26-like [Gastrophryne carolinensis]